MKNKEKTERQKDRKTNTNIDIEKVRCRDGEIKRQKDRTKKTECLKT